LSKICLSDEQRAALEPMGKELNDKERGVADAHHALVTALAEQVKSGHVDERALAKEVDAVVKAREDASPVLRKDIDCLHGILDPGQRAALVDNIQKDMKDAADASDKWSEAFAKDLNLTDDQKSKIHGELDKAKPQIDAERSKVKETFDAFKKDDFS